MKKFKSIDSLDLSLSQVNVFAGANSSGKSSILQSILLLKQTIQYAPPARSLALNGPILKLGSIADVKNALCGPADNIGLGFSLDTTNMARGAFSRLALTGGRIKTVSANLQWVAPVANNTSHGDDATAAMSPVLAEASYDIVREDDGSKSARFFASIVKKKDDSVNFPHSHQVSRLDDASKREITAGKPDSEIIGAGVSHFFLSFIGVQFEATKQRSRKVADAICGGNEALHDTPFYVPFAVVETIRSWLKTVSSDDFDVYFEDLDPDMDDEVTLSDVVDAFRYLRRSVTASGSADVAAKLIDTSALSEMVESQLMSIWGPNTTVDFGNPRIFSEANERIKAYLTSYVRYLGPLRDEPRHVYPLEALSQPDDVGYRGEHTAAVLELNSQKAIEYVPSEIFSKGVSTWQDATTRTSLRSAVVDWLTYVGVAVGFTASDRGVFGHQLKVRTADALAFHDLTNVGVGVSQVLPIIVGSLLAPKGSCLIFEQPELHLHPKVQARLADFFLALGFGGKQCLLETHSEYLVDRLRLRIAQARGDDVAKQVRIFFTQKSEGVTTCTPVVVSNYGAALQWPQDFFDQSQREIEAIVKAASAKRRSERDTPQVLPDDGSDIL